MDSIADRHRKGSVGQLQRKKSEEKVLAMKLFSVFLLSNLALKEVGGFAPVVSQLSRKCTALASTMDAEALLRKAAQLKAEAAAAEQSLHKTLLEKKQCKDSDLDDCIEKLFPVGDISVAGVAKRLKENHWSTDKLLEITRRLHAREVAAQGKGHVAASLHHDHTKFENVSSDNPKELARVDKLIDKLVEAAEIIDEEYMAEKRQSKEQKYLSHVDLDHWTMGDLAGNLRRQVGELRREHEEQFVKRLNSFYEAQTKEELRKPSDKNKKA